MHDCQGWCKGRKRRRPSGNLNLKKKLTSTLTEKEFDAGYWYATEIKAFAREIGIQNHSKLRKDELEHIIKHFLRTGRVTGPARQVRKQGVKDVDKGLTLSLPIIHYTSNKKTKDFIVREALKMDPALKKRSGARYRLNRWREEQIGKGNRITYGDLVRQYVKLNQTDQPFAKIPSGRYINFLSEFLAREKGSTRPEAVAAWHALMKMPVAKNYQAWSRFRLKK